MDYYKKGKNILDLVMIDFEGGSGPTERRGEKVGTSKRRERNVEVESKRIRERKREVTCASETWSFSVCRHTERHTL